jgi:hypothetical protein
MAEITEDRRPVLRLCPWDELLETCRAIAPVAAQASRHKKIGEARGTTKPIRFDAESFDSMVEMHGAISLVEIFALWLLGNALNEVDYRKKLSDEQMPCRSWPAP